MHEYKTGAKRSARMPRYDLIPKVFLDRLAIRFTGQIGSDGKPDGGALKYGESNWERGLPTSDVINHIINHLTNYQEGFRQELSRAIRIYSDKHTDKDFIMNSVRNEMCNRSNKDDDLAAAAWGIAVLMYQEGTGMFHDDQFPLEANTNYPSPETDMAKRPSANQVQLQGQNAKSPYRYSPSRPEGHR